MEYYEAKELIVALRQIGIIAYMTGILWLRRNPLSMLFSAISPFSILFVLFVVSNGQYESCNRWKSCHGNCWLRLGTRARHFILQDRIQDSRYLRSSTSVVPHIHDWTCIVRTVIWSPCADRTYNLMQHYLETLYPHCHCWFVAYF